jgi:3-oxoacyl-(acyl-carrier-protein) synthase
MPRSARVAVTGLGVVAPGGALDARSFHASCIEGKPCIVSRQFSLLSGPRPAGVVNGFKLSEPPEVELDRFAEFALHASRQAAYQAGLIDSEQRSTGCVPADELGVTFATAIGGTAMMERVFAELTDAGRNDLPFRDPGSRLYEASMFNSVATRIGALVGARGPCLTVSTGCTAGIDAIGWAYETICAGEARVMLAGAAEAPFANITFASFDIIGALSKRAHEPTRASRPFDKHRDGFVLSEGAAFVVLEDLAHAQARGVRPLAEILGFNSSNNALHMTDLAADGASMGDLLEELLDRAELAPEAIHYVNAHGSSTPQNDLFETNAYKQAFGRHAYAIPASSTKSMIGHPLSAASALGTASVILAMQSGRIPPTINLETPDPECDLDYVANAAKAGRVDRAVVTASGFSGIHSALLVGSHREPGTIAERAT